MGHCKSCIKSINEGNSLKLGTDRDTTPCFVTRISHNFTFVLWATIDLTRRKLPSVNQFFESLYLTQESCPLLSKPLTDMVSPLNTQTVMVTATQCTKAVYNKRKCNTMTGMQYSGLLTPGPKASTKQLYDTTSNRRVTMSISIGVWPTDVKVYPVQ